jgi:DNA (cytosine-5)-methyltransferase 1
VKPQLLDLFCGAGGAAMGYHRAGFDVTGVDIKPQPRYPFAFMQADALKVLFAVGRVFDVIHASPPCQRFTAYRRRGDGVGDSYENLIGPLRTMLVDSRRPWVIENVQGAPLRNPLMLCGSSFGLDVRRHRYFESPVAFMSPPCAHGWQPRRFAAATNREGGSRRTVEVGVWRIPLPVQQRAMGINWMTLEELSEAIPPAYTQFIGEQLLAHLEVSRV